MRPRLLTLALLFILLLAVGCKSTDQGSREFIPGKGWVPVD